MSKKGASITQQLLILLKKNVLVYRRKPFSAFVEFVIPLYTVFWIWMFSYTIDYYYVEYPKIPSSPVSPSIDIKNVANYIAYYPRNDDTNALISLIEQTIGVTSNSLKGFSSYDDMYDNFFAKCPANMFAVIDLSEYSEDNPSFVLRYNYTTNYGIFNYNQTNPSELDYTKIPYQKEYIFFLNGISSLEEAIYRAIYNKKSSSKMSDSLIKYSSRFGFPEESDAFNVQQYIQPMYYYMYVFTTMQALTVLLGSEKERGIKDMLLMNGMSEYMYWLSWLVFEIIWLILPNAILLLGLYVVKALRYTSYSLFYVYSYIFSVSTIPFTFILSVCVKKASTLFSLMILLLSFLPLLYYLVQYLLIAYDVHRVVVGIFYLIPTVTYSIFVHDITEGEAYRKGMDWNNINIYGAYTEDAFIVQSICVFLYFFVALYLVKVVQQNLETPLPFCYFLMPSYYKRNNQSSNTQKDETNGIVIENIHKTYNKGKKNEFNAVKGVNLKIKRNEIFALLGHNGAGKTTLLNMTIGLLTPNEGEIYINGNSIIRNKEEVRKSLGVCPQFDILYDQLTPMDHILLYGNMKGLKDNELREQGKRLLESVGLTFKMNECAGTFSGGQKRRLSLILSLIGNPEIVVLDEPTTGLDPYNRRKVWNLLEEEKKNKTIILTTHSMEEADALGDEIAVMSGGLIQAQGTSLELKMKYGRGYHLNIKKNENCEIEKLNETIKEIIEYKRVNDNGSELKYILPLEDRSKLSTLFKKLEEKKEELHFGSISMTMPSLEDVFVELDKRSKQELNSNSISPDTQSPDIQSPDSKTTEIEMAEGIKNETVDKIRKSESRVKVKLLDYTVNMSLWNQFKGFCYMLSKTQMREGWNTMFAIYYPIIMALVCSVIDLTVLRDLNEYEFEVSKYPHQYSSEKLFVPYVSSPSIDTLVSNIKEQFPDNYEFKLVTRDEIEKIRVDTYERNTNYNNKIIPFCLYDDNGLNVIANGNINYNSRAITYLFYNSYYRKVSNGKEINVKHMRMKDTVISPTTGISFANGGVMIIIASIFGFICSIYGENIAREKSKNIKSQLLISSLNRKIYWLSHAVVDTITTLIPFIICIIIMACFSFKGVTDNNFFAFVLMVILYSPLSAVFGYVSILPFRSLQAVQQWHGEVIQFMTLVPWLFTSFTTNPSKLVMNLCGILPPYGIYRAFSLLESAAKTGVPYSFKDLFDPDKDLIFMFIIFLVEIILFSLVLYYVEIYLPEWQFKLEKKKSATFFKSTKVDLEKGNEERGDENVEREVERIKEKGNDSSKYDLIHIKELSKVFKKSDGKYFQAVNRLSLGIGTGELFGLLGENGAGKTTLIKILTGIEIASEGEGYINHYSITNELEKARSSLGVCPQFDALYDSLTPLEYLNGYTLLFGIEKDTRKRLIKDYLESVNLTEKKNSRITSLSGGNKRRMSVLLSLIGNPKVVFLDEPSTGMDPITRRSLWNFIEDIRENGKVIVLTTHSMEEAETLCNRIGILTHGNMRCLGTSADLKRDYGNGYFLTVRLNKNVNNLEENQKEVEKMIQELYPKGVLTSQSSSIIRIYHINEGNIQFSKIFEELENNKEKLSIDEYSILETTLDDVFLFFADEGNKDPDEA